MNIYLKRNNVVKLVNSQIKADELIRKGFVVIEEQPKEAVKDYADTGQSEESAKDSDGTEQPAEEPKNSDGTERPIEEPENSAKDSDGTEQPTGESKAADANKTEDNPKSSAGTKKTSKGV